MINVSKDIIENSKQFKQQLLKIEFHLMVLKTVKYRKGNDIQESWISIS